MEINVQFLKLKKISLLILLVVCILGKTNAAPTNAAPTNAAPTNAAPTNAAPTNAAPTNAAPTNVTSSQIDSITKRIEAIENKNKEKDIWDKIQSTAPLISGLLVALIGALATYLFNKQKTISESEKNAKELSILEIQTVQGFISHLSSNDDTQVKAALYAIEALGNQELVTKLAGLFGGKGALEALFTISSQREGELKEKSNLVIGNILNSKQISVVQIITSTGSTGTGFFIDEKGLIVTVRHMIEGGSQLKIKLINGDIYDGKLIKYHEKRDVAYLKIEDFNSIPLKVFKKHFNQPLAQIAIIGVSSHTRWETRVGTMIGSYTHGELNEFKTQLMDLSFSDGYSGAPIFNSDGIVIGILQAYKRGESKIYLIPAEII